MKLKKLKFVDTKRYSSGVDMDIKTQLLTLALKPGQKPNDGLIAQSVWNAGYEAIERYVIEAGKLKSYPYPKLKE